MLLRELVTILLGLGGVRLGDPNDISSVIEYTDTCDYTRGNVTCGDQCILWGDNCHCGSSDTFRPYLADQYCCLSSRGSCTRTPGRYSEDGVCNEGRTLSMTSPCNDTNTAMRCYNEYTNSQHIGLKSHFRDLRGWSGDGSHQGYGGQFSINLTTLNT